MKKKEGLRDVEKSSPVKKKKKSASGFFSVNWVNCCLFLSSWFKYVWDSGFFFCTQAPSSRQIQRTVTVFSILLQHTQGLQRVSV